MDDIEKSKEFRTLAVTKLREAGKIAVWWFGIGAIIVSILFIFEVMHGADAALIIGIAGYVGVVRALIPLLSALVAGTLGMPPILDFAIKSPLAFGIIHFIFISLVGVASGVTIVPTPIFGASLGFAVGCIVFNGVNKTIRTVFPVTE